ncbi:MAG: YihY/virulence factor BrkB family protein [bacterium]
MEILKKITIPGFQGLRVYTILRFFIRGFSSKDINLRASAIAFSFFLALFPATIFFFTLIAYIPVDNLKDEIFNFIATITPENTFEVVQSTLKDILKNRKGGLLSLGFILAMYFSTNGINTLIDSFNDYSDVIEVRSGWKQKLAALGLTFYVAFLVVITIILTIVGNVAVDYLYNKNILDDSLEYYLVVITEWFFIVFFIYALISGLFFYGPSKKRKWAFFSAGSTLATMLSVITTYGFMLYVNHFDSYNKLYGSIGTLLVIMFLIYINAMVMLIGFELNVSIDRALEQENSTDEISPESLENSFEQKRYD